MDLRDSGRIIPGSRRFFSDVREVKGLISVVIPSYQSKWCIAETIDSVLHQTYQNFEIIVVDDGSTDSTAEHIKNEFGEKVKIFRQKNHGLAYARNSGIELAEGEFIQFLDADDLLLPTKFEKQERYLFNHPEICSISCNYVEYDVVMNNKKAINIDDNHEIHFSDLILSNDVGVVHSSLTRTSIVKKIGGFDEDFGNYCADWELWLTISWLGYRIIQDPEVLAIYRRHPKSLTRSKIYPNRVGELAVAMRGKEYSKTYDTIDLSTVNESISTRQLKAAYWAVIDDGWKKAYEHITTSLQYVPNRRRTKQWLKGMKIILLSKLKGILNQNPQSRKILRVIRKITSIHLRK